jgi:hypothetical protein
MFSFRLRWRGFRGGLESTERFFPDLIEVGSQQGDAFGIQLIDSASAGLAVADETRILQHFQMLRDGGTAYRHGSGKFVDGHRTACELLEDGHAGRVAECFEPAL